MPWLRKYNLTIDIKRRKIRFGEDNYIVVVYFINWQNLIINKKQI